jgi:hypothetical protein
MIRVNRLAEFSPIGWLFSSVSLKRNKSPKRLGLFFPQKKYA